MILEVRVGSTTESSPTISAREEWSRKISYMSMGLEAKAVKERYIRVAAIDIVTREGSRDICSTDPFQNLHNVVTAMNVRG